MSEIQASQLKRLLCDDFGINITFLLKYEWTQKIILASCGIIVSVHVQLLETLTCPFVSPSPDGHLHY